MDARRAYVGANLFGQTHNVEVSFRDFETLIRAVEAVFHPLTEKACPWGIDCPPFAIEDLRVYDDMGATWQVCLSAPSGGSQLWVHQPPSVWHACVPTHLTSPLEGIAARDFIDLRFIFFSLSPVSNHVRRDDLRGCFMRSGIAFESVAFVPQEEVSYGAWEDLCRQSPLLRASVGSVAAHLRRPQEPDSPEEADPSSPEPVHVSPVAPPDSGLRKARPEANIESLVTRLQRERQKAAETMARMRSESRVPDQSPIQSRAKLNSTSPSERSLSMAMSESWYPSAKLRRSECRAPSVASPDVPPLRTLSDRGEASLGSTVRSRAHSDADTEELIRASRARRQEEQAALQKMSISGDQKAPRCASEAPTEVSTATSTYVREKDKEKWGKEFDVLEQAIAAARRRRETLSAPSSNT
eukprot:TRINITY_DN33047_c0_g1_i1.p1 TRINITY_DN33047_c0_g1~~TRINITY_DN33047_c0_g1_i1.p1  ORF type:complete len:413 (+),score=47.69 TRINITY_DN33047_c0_g1_i1:34-1272(+)